MAWLCFTAKVGRQATFDKEQLPRHSPCFSALFAFANHHWSRWRPTPGIILTAQLRPLLAGADSYRTAAQERRSFPCRRAELPCHSLIIEVSDGPGNPFQLSFSHFRPRAQLSKLLDFLPPASPTSLLCSSEGSLSQSGRRPIPERLRDLLHPGITLPQVNYTIPAQLRDQIAREPALSPVVRLPGSIFSPFDP